MTEINIASPNNFPLKTVAHIFPHPSAHEILLKGSFREGLLAVREKLRYLPYTPSNKRETEQNNQRNAIARDQLKFLGELGQQDCLSNALRLPH